MYHNETPIMTDTEYDILFEQVKKSDPQNSILKQTGAPLPSLEKNKVTLPYFMGSMDKIKPDTDALIQWKKKFTGPYVISCKLDGVSGLYTVETNPNPICKLYTRGDGKVGQDISHLIPYLRLPNINTKTMVAIRGEFIVSKENFKKYNQYANPRNMVAGIINQKSKNMDTDILKDVDFVAYELVTPLKKASEQLSILKELDIDVVFFVNVGGDESSEHIEAVEDHVVVGSYCEH
jgi:NAD-dependent DNA ligase